MSDDDNVPVSANNGGDNLQEIKGIGPDSARALNKIGIYRFADFLRYNTPEQLQQALEEAGEKIALWKIQKFDWLGQAKVKVLAQQAESEYPSAQEERETTQERPPSPKEEWEQYAGFNLYFEFKTDQHGQQVWRTLVFKSLDPDSFNDREEFPGIEPSQWANWILEQANLPTSAVPVVAKTEGAAINEITLERGETMDEIKLKRGNREVTFSKVPDTFAVRLKQGRATDEAALEASLGRPRVAVKHVDSAAPERMEIFRVEETARMEETMDEMRESPTADVVSHVYTLDDTPGGAMIPTGTMTIQFKPDVAKTKQEEILAEFGLEVVEDLDYLPRGYTVRLSEASTENPLKIAAKLQQRAEIEVAEPDLSFQVSLKYVPTAPLYREQWHLKNRGDRLGLVVGADVKAEEAWDITRGKRDVTICIIDDGFDLGHPKFNVPGKVVAPRDFGQTDFDPTPVFADDNHGTACAGVALAEDSGVGVVGLAPDCSFMPVRMSEWLSDNAVVDYFQYAVDHGADVVSCSWSAKAWNFPLSTKIQAIIHQAATQGRSNKKGCVILFAAGNEARPLDGVKDGQISYQGFALHLDVIAVAASNSMDKHSSYSNFGPELTICAPSSGYPGRSIVTTDRRGLNGYTSGDYTFSFSGTSSATPLAAGLAALILSVNPELTAAEVKEIMMNAADKIDQGNGQYVDGHSPLYGHGRINAHQAVQYALEPSREPPEDVKEPDEEVKLELEILDVKLSVVGPSVNVPVRRLMAEVHFEVSGESGGAVTTERAPYEIAIRTVELDNEVTQLVASKQGELEPQMLTYTSRPTFPIPDLGRYELQSRVMLFLPSGSELSALHQGPTLRVDP